MMFDISQLNGSAAVAFAVPDTVKEPAAGTAMISLQVASRACGVMITREAAVTSEFVMTTDDAPAAMALFPVGRLMVAAPGVPVESVPR